MKKSNQAAGILLLLGIMVFAPQSSLGARADLTTIIAATNSRLQALNGKFKTASGGIRTAGASGSLKNTLNEESLLQEMKASAKLRKKAMEELMSTDPQSALNLALSSQNRSQLPRAVQEDVEAMIAIKGTLEVIISDDFAAKTSTTEHFIRAGREYYSLHFAGTGPLETSGSQVLLKGLKLGQHIVIPRRAGEK